MKKLSVLLASSLLFMHISIAEQLSTSSSVMQSAPVDAISVPETEDLTTNALTNEENNDNESVFIDDNLKVTPKTNHVENAEYHYTIDVTYPQIAGNTLTPGAQQFNQMIQKLVDAEIDRFKNSVKLDVVHMNTLPEEVRKNHLTMDYDIDVIKPDVKLSVVSIRLSIEGMQAGRAHPFHAYQVLNFDLTHGRELSLNNLFRKKSNYLAVIAQYSHQKLNETLQDKWLIAEGTKAKPENYKNWNLQADSLLITFDEYQVAPYVDGPQEIEIPLSKLTSLIADNAPVLAEFKSSAVMDLAKIADKSTKKIRKTKNLAKNQPNETRDLG